MTYAFSCNTASVGEKYLRNGGFRGQLWRPFEIYADEFAFTAFVLKFYEAFDQRKERIVFAASDVFARFPFCSALTRQNVAAENFFAAEFL